MPIDIKETFLDLLFPRYCLGCGLEGCWLCHDCRQKIITLDFYYCPACKRRLSEIGTCLNCAPGSHLDGLYVMTDYENDLVKGVIQSLKYDFLTELADSVKELAGRYLAGNKDWSGDYLLVPIPLHRKRHLLRGFNQAELIAQAISKLMGNSISDLLVRTSSGRPQATLSAEQRKKNAIGIYKIAQRRQPEAERQIVLVDDVYTTGATMQECAKVLKQAGFKRVRGLAVASG